MEDKSVDRSMEMDRGFLSFKDHCSKEILALVGNATAQPPPVVEDSLFEVAYKSTGRRYSRWMFWCIYSGLIDAALTPEQSLERIILKRNDYEAKKARHLKKLAETEQSDVDNPLSTQYRVSFELETKNQINIDLVRMSFKREQLAPFNANLFNILYVWGFENCSLGYRQG